MKSIFQIIVFTLLISHQIFSQAPALTIPNFSFSKPDKSLFTNKNLEPGKLLFFFFFDSDCDHCQHAVNNLNQHYNDYKKAAIYLISLDDQQKINSFINKYAANLKGKQNVTILRDTKNKFISIFKPRKYPAMFLYTSEKKLADYEDNEESMFRFLKFMDLKTK